MLREIRRYAGHVDSVSGLALHPNGAWFASSSFDRTAILRGLDKPKILHSFMGHQGLVMGVAFSPDGTLLATAGMDNGARIHRIPADIRNAKDGRGAAIGIAAIVPDLLDKRVPKDNVRVLQSPNGILACAFHPKGKQLATAGHDGAIRVWDLETGATAKVLNPPKGEAIPAYSAQWLDDGKQVLSSSFDKSLKLWDAAAGMLIRDFKGMDAKTNGKGHEDQVLCAAVSPDGKWIASGSSDKKIKLWNINDANEMRDAVNPDLKPGESHPAAVLAAKFHPSGKYFVGVGRGTRGTGYLSVWEMPSLKRVFVETLPDGNAMCLEILPKDASLLIGFAASRERKSGEVVRFAWPL